MTRLSAGRSSERRDSVPPATGNAAGAGHANSLLGGLAGKLQARGLRVQLVSSAADAITVTNPAAPGRGTVHVGADGLVSWDSGAGTVNDAGAATILDHVTSVLRGSRADPDDRWAAVDGERLRQLRRQRRLTQLGLAGRAGVSLSTVGALERRRRGRCRNRTAALLAVALETELASLSEVTGHAGKPSSGPVSGSRRRAGRPARGEA
jgi:DNA-binding XRE family transcriptional regulator